MHKTDKLDRCKQSYSHHYQVDQEVKQMQRKGKQKYWWVLTESVLAGIAWNG